MEYFLTELDATGSIDASNVCIIKGKFGTRQMESIFQKYIDAYVQCHNCKHLDTNMEREAVSRLNFMKCNLCKSQRSLIAIKGGYHATTKKDRKEARENN